MEVSKVKEKLIKLPSANGLFNKISATLQTARVPAPRSSEEDQDSLCPQVMMEYRIHQLKVELMRAQAQEMAQRLRQRIV